MNIRSCSIGSYRNTHFVCVSNFQTDADNWSLTFAMVQSALQAIRVRKCTPGGRFSIHTHSCLENPFFSYGKVIKNALCLCLKSSNWCRQRAANLCDGAKCSASDSIQEVHTRKTVSYTFCLEKSMFVLYEAIKKLPMFVSQFVKLMQTTGRSPMRWCKALCERSDSGKLHEKDSCVKLVQKTPGSYNTN